MVTVHVQDIPIGCEHPLVLIAGPCVIESRDHCLYMAQELKDITSRLSIPFIFKSSYDKANRTSQESYRGPGMEKGLLILQELSETFSIPILSDVHTVAQVQAAAQVLDIIQVPAFLCRQTDLLIAISESGKPVNVKKGQFLAPWDVQNVVSKLISTGNDQILLTERGVCFGYNNWVVDMRSLPIMRKLGYPVVFDATHSVQLPGGRGTSSGGQREFVPVLARAAVAAGVDALFIEVHNDPDSALSDGPNMMHLTDVPDLLKVIKDIDSIVRDNEGH